VLTPEATMTTHVATTGLATRSQPCISSSLTTSEVKGNYIESRDSQTTPPRRRNGLSISYRLQRLIMNIIKKTNISGRCTVHNRSTSGYLFYFAPMLLANHASCSFFCFSHSFLNFLRRLFVISSPAASRVGIPSSSHALNSFVRNISR